MPPVGAQNSDQQIEQALSRLRQAGDAMKRSGSPQQSADAARQAADQLREAEKLLGGTQQQLASGKLNSLSHEAGRLTQEERAQADRINKLAGKQDEADATDDASNNQMDRDRMMNNSVSAISSQVNGSNYPMTYRSCRRTFAIRRVKWLRTNPVSLRSCAMPSLRWINPISITMCRERQTGCEAESIQTQMVPRTRSPRDFKN